MNQTQEPNSQNGHQPAKNAPRDEREETTPMTRWPWLAQLLLALVIIVAVVVLLVGLPTASLLVTERIPSVSDGNSIRGMVSFWGAMFAAFISLVVLFIGAVFAFTAFRVELGAKFEARDAAEKGVEQIEKKVEKMTKDAEKMKNETEEIYKTREEIKEDADRDIKDFINENGARITGKAAKDYIDTNGKETTERVAQSYVNTNGEEITREVADVCAKNYVDHNGPKVTEKAAVAFVSRNGDEITRGVVEGYVNETDAEGEPSRCERIIRQVVENYAKGAVDGYASEDPEGKGVTRVEKMTRETVEKIIADEIAGLVDKYLASLGLVDRLRIGFRRRGRHDRPGSADKGQG